MKLENISNPCTEPDCTKGAFECVQIFLKIAKVYLVLVSFLDQVFYINYFIR